MADGNPGSRVYAYDVSIIGKDSAKPLCKSVYFAGVNLGVGHEPDGGRTTLLIAGDELPVGRKLTISVTPLSSLGTKGKAIGAIWKA
jgi:hypothetical protein